LVKLDSTGSFAWHTFLPDLAWRLLADALGRLYLCGQSDHSWNGPGGEAPLQPFAGWQDATIIALDEDGAYLWHTFIGADGVNACHGVVRGDGDGVVLIGRSDHSWDGPQGESPFLPHSGGQNLFALSVDPSGDYRWHSFAWFAELGSSGGVYGTARRETGELFFAGSSLTNWLGPQGETPQNALAGGMDIMLLGMSNYGGYRWHSFYGSPQGGHDGAPIDEASAACLGPQSSFYAAGTSTVPWDGPQGQPPLRAGDFDDVVVLKVTLP
jgi:hypothetical protein